MTIILGWWLLPLLITIGLFLFAFFKENKSTGDWLGLGEVIEVWIRFIIAGFGSLVAWLVYFILN